MYKDDVSNPQRKDLGIEKLPRNVLSSCFCTWATLPIFINFSIQNKLDLEMAMMDCLFAKCTPCITDCVIAELEKLGQEHRVTLRVAKDPRFETLPCTHKGTSALRSVLLEINATLLPHAIGMHS